MKRSVALPLGFSLLLHAALLLGVWQSGGGPGGAAPGAEVIDTRVRADEIRLSLAAPERPRGRRPHGSGPAPSPLPPDFEARLVEPVAPALPPASPPASPAALPLAPPPAVPPGGTGEQTVLPAGGRSAPGPAAGEPSGAGVARAVLSRPLFAPPARAASVVFVLDRSVSMGPSGALEMATREVARCLHEMPPGTRFQVVPYHHLAEPLLLGGRRDLVVAAPAVVAEAVGQLAGLQAAGATLHAQALRRGLALRPDVLYLVTDADELSPADLASVTRFNQGRSEIHCVELNAGRGDGGLLARLALGNGGSYRRVAPR